MRGFAGSVLLIGSIAVFAACGCVLAGLSLAVRAAPVVDSGAVIQFVDRTQKADRLQPGTNIGREPLPNARQVAPIGCDLMFSLLSSAPKNAPARCVA
jgi:hypothetical protein